MKHISWIVPLLFVAGTAIGQPAGVSVALTASPANESVVGSAVTLTATVRTPGIGVQQVGAAAPLYERDRMRFTFKAQRTWPCPETTTLAENVPATGGSSGHASLVTVSHIATRSWLPPAAKAGEYTLSVDVTYVGVKKGAMTPQMILKPESLGSATLKYKAKPPAGFPGNTILSASPQSGSAVSFPVNLTLSASASTPSDPAPSKWRFTFQCQGCSPNKSNPIESAFPSASWTTSVSTPGAHNLFVYVDKVRLSDCLWQFSHLRYDYGYYLNAQ